MQRKLEGLGKISFKMTQWIGTPYSMVVHTLFFIGIFGLEILGVGFDQILLILTTAVSLEAIYLAIFIQMTVNKNTQSLEAVEEDIEDIQEDVEGLEDDVEEISEDIDDEEKARRALNNIEVEINKMREDISFLKKRGML